MRRILLVFCLLAWFCPESISQEKEEASKEKMSAYELISSYYKQNFAPFAKGNGFVGLAFSLQDENLTNTQRLFDQVVVGSQLDYRLTFKGGYFIADYVMVGANFSYQRDRFTGSLIDQNSDTVQRNTVLSQGLFLPNLKIYYPLTKNERLSFYNQIGLGFGGGNELTRDTKGLDQINKTYTESFFFSVGISPGVTFFAIENFAFELELNNLVGYELESSKTTINETQEAKQVTHNVSFQVNLFSLRFGLAYYIRAKRKK